MNFVRAWDVGRAIPVIERVEVVPCMFRDPWDYTSWMAGVPRYVYPKRPKDKLSSEKRALIVPILGDSCAWCGADASSTYLELDHIVPSAFGGSWDLRNLQLLCHRCNVVRWRNYFRPIRDRLVTAGLIDRVA